MSHALKGRGKYTKGSTTEERTPFLTKALSAPIAPRDHLFNKDGTVRNIMQESFIVKWSLFCDKLTRQSTSWRAAKNISVVLDCATVMRDLFFQGRLDDPEFHPADHKFEDLRVVAKVKADFAWLQSTDKDGGAAHLKEALTNPEFKKLFDASKEFIDFLIAPAAASVAASAAPTR